MLRVPDWGPTAVSSALDDKTHKPIGNNGNDKERRQRCQSFCCRRMAGVPRVVLVSSGTLGSPDRPIESRSAKVDRADGTPPSDSGGGLPRVRVGGGAEPADTLKAARVVSPLRSPRYPPPSWSGWSLLAAVTPAASCAPPPAYVG